MMTYATTLLTLAAAAAPAMAAPAPQAGGGGPKLCAQSASGPGAEDSSGTYEVNNNVWTKPGGPGTQCTSVTANGAGGITWSTVLDWATGTANGDPISFPYSGVKVGAPQAISAIKKMPSSVAWSYDTFPKGDVAYDLFTAKDPAHPVYAGVAADFEIMIWLQSSPDVHPKGSTDGAKATGLKLAGASFDLIYGKDDNAATYTFIPSQGQAPLAKFDADVYSFIDYLVKNQQFDPQQQLTKFQFGSEVYSTKGDSTFKVTGFTGSIE